MSLLRNQEWRAEALLRSEEILLRALRRYKSCEARSAKQDGAAYLIVHGAILLRKILANLKKHASEL
jgi:hypothetical protein